MDLGLQPQFRAKGRSEVGLVRLDRNLLVAFGAQKRRILLMLQLSSMFSIPLRILCCSSVDLSSLWGVRGFSPARRKALHIRWALVCRSGLVGPIQFLEPWVNWILLLHVGSRYAGGLMVRLWSSTISIVGIGF